MVALFAIIAGTRQFIKGRRIIKTSIATGVIILFPCSAGLYSKGVLRIW
ncbi:MAG: hypothetical protein K2Q22_07125 [Cytophagales bacterium]|nr:hypothetical protein [Cytophagales bacterium]